MNSRLELGRIAGIPIYLDMFFMLVMIVFSMRYFTSGDVQVMSFGLLIIAGVIASILLHELGHALVAHLFSVGTREIELTGLGGVAKFASTLPRSVVKRVLIFLAGPAANLGLYFACGAAGGASLNAEKPLLAGLLFQLASINFYFMFFNLLPAYPLDGGHTLDAIFVRIFGGKWGQRIVAGCGIVVSLYLLFTAVQGLPNRLFLLLLALYMAELNWRVMQSTGVGR